MERASISDPEPLVVVGNLLQMFTGPPAQCPDQLSPDDVEALGLALGDSCARALFVKGVATLSEASDILGCSEPDVLARYPGLRGLRIAGHLMFDRHQVERQRELKDLRTAFAPYYAPHRREPDYWDRYWKRRQRRRKRNRKLMFTLITFP